MQKTSRAEITDLEKIPNVGPSIAANLRLIGVSSSQDLLGKDPYTMYDDLCHNTGVRHDPCVIDVFIAAPGPFWTPISIRGKAAIRGHRPGRPSVPRLHLSHPEELEPIAAGDRQGRTPAQGCQPAVRGH